MASLAGKSYNPNRILAGLVIGAAGGVAVLALGGAFPWLLQGARKVAAAALDPFAQVFLRLLFFVIMPLVFASLTAGIVQLGKLNRLGPLAGRTFVIFFGNMLVATTLGLVLMNVLNPGARMSGETRERLMSEFGSPAQAYAEGQASAAALTPQTAVDMFLPRNLLGAVVGNDKMFLGDVLPLIVFAILVGAAGTALATEKRARLLAGLDLVAELMTGIVHFALRLAPFAVAAMIFSVVVKAGVDILVALGLFIAGCMGMMALHLFGTMALLLRFLGKRSPVEFFRTVKSVLVTAFSTSSSSATLPMSLACARDSLGVRPSVSGFVLPLGATMNMSGTALYEGCVVLFVAQVMGMHLALGQQVILVLMAVLSAVAAAGIPGGSLPLIAGLLATFGIPPEGIGIVLGADRLLDMARSAVNTGSDLVTAVIVDRQTGDVDLSQGGG